MELRKTSAIKERRYGIILSYLSLGLSTIISLIFTPFLLKKIGQQEYGLYQLIGSLANYLMLLSLGMSGSYIRFYSKAKADGENDILKLNGIYIIAYSIISLVAIVAGIIITIFLPSLFSDTMSQEEVKKGQVMMIIMTVNSAVTLPTTVFTSYISANEKFIFHRFVRLIYGVAHPLLCLVVLLLGGKATELVMVALISSVIVIISEIYYCLRKLAFKFTFQGIKANNIKEIVVFSSFIFLNDIINQINWSVDKIILGALSGTVAIAIYGVAAQINTYFLSISTTVSSVFAPKVNQIVASSIDENDKRKELNNVFIHVGTIQTYIIMLVVSGYIFFGSQFIKLWAGSDYQQSYYVGLWLIIPESIPLLQNIGIEIQRAKNKHKIRTIVYLIIAIGNLLLSIPLCKLYGAVGCAIGTAISLVIGNIIFMNYYYHNCLDIDIIAFWKKVLRILPGLIIPCGVGYLIMKCVNISSYLALAIYILIYAIIYCCSVFTLGMNSKTRNLYINKIREKFACRRNRGLTE